MARVLLLLPTATYRAPDFVGAASRLGVDVVVGSEERQAMAGAMGDRAVVVPLDDAEAGAAAIAALAERTPLDAVVGVDDQGVVVAATASARLGLRTSPPGAVARTRDKAAMRTALADAGLPQPDFVVVGADEPAPVPPWLPCVVKPAGAAASRGVIRVDEASAVAATVARVRAIAGADVTVLLERYVPGAEVALEGLLRAGQLEVLALFDKPDPLEGPYFEETIYVTPSRLSGDRQRAVAELVARAAAALGLVEGPIHAEIRLDGGRLWLIEVAARSIGGLCARSLRFGAGISLEEVILRHALGLPLESLARERAASGVMMLPIPRAGTLRRVTGQDEARATEGVVGLEVTIANGRPVVPLPEGDRYLGFLFARGETPEAVETSLRLAHSRLRVDIEPDP